MDEYNELLFDLATPSKIGTHVRSFFDEWF